MTNNAALSGDYVDLRFVKSRKVCQVVIEIPIEQGSAFVQAFGTPNPATGVPVAIARMKPETPAPKAEKPRRQWSELSRAQQAGIECNDAEFQSFLADRDGKSEAFDAMEAAGYVRRWCGVTSRSALDQDPIAADKWDRLYSDYQMWKAGAAA